jgi:hypothetical protein
MRVLLHVIRFPRIEGTWASGWSIQKVTLWSDQTYAWCSQHLCILRSSIPRRQDQILVGRKLFPPLYFLLHSRTFYYVR